MEKSYRTKDLQLNPATPDKAKQDPLSVLRLFADRESILIESLIPPPSPPVADTLCTGFKQGFWVVF